MEIDERIIEILKKIPGVQIEGYLDYAIEGGHFLMHAVFTLFILGLPVNPLWALASFVAALAKELILDEKANRSNLIFRCSGALFPFVSLLWRTHA